MSTHSISDIQAIDVHGHYGAYTNAKHPLTNEFHSGDLELVAARAAQANTAITIVSPLQALTPRGHGDPVGANEDAARCVGEFPSLRFYVVIDPLRPQTFEQAEVMLRQDECVGIKIHPEEHLYPIKEHGKVLFEFAQEQNAVILTHSGEERSLPGDFVQFADDFPDVKLILAHLGCGYDGDPTYQVRAIQKTTSENVYVDTSSAQSITPRLIEWAVEEIGAEKILYGTDTPLYCTTMQRIRIDEADIGDAEKQLILRDNARRIFTI
ncbi:MAG: amidohydrolase family protein [Abditibacteriaceae bacterium]